MGNRNFYVFEIEIFLGHALDRFVDIHGHRSRGNDHVRRDGLAEADHLHLVLVGKFVVVVSK